MILIAIKKQCVFHVSLFKMQSKKKSDKVLIGQYKFIGQTFVFKSYKMEKIS